MSGAFQASVGVSRKTSAREAGIEAAELAARRSEGARVALLFAATSLDQAEVFEGVRSVLGGVPIFGASSFGEIGSLGYQTGSVVLRDQPGWITFSLDGRLAYPSTGEVVDIASRKIVAALSDETGAAVHSEKVVEIHFAGGVPVRTGDQFGVGRVR